MSESKKSFWSTIPGLVTGLAGLLTGIVGLITVLIQLGVVGGGHNSNGKTVAASNGAVSTLPGTSATTVGDYGYGAGAGSGANTTVAAGTFTVLPATIDFLPTDAKDKDVTVKNTSDTAKITVDQPTITGTDAAQFSASYDTCTSAPLPAGGSCTLKITFKPSGPLRKYSATLRVSAVGAPRVSEVAITASTLL